MAKLPALIRALVALDGREQSTLELIARQVREAGLIATTKRGSGASEMTAADAAAFLIGANASQSIRGAPGAVRQFRELRRLNRPDGEADTMPNGHAHNLIRKAETFGEALEALIHHIPNLDFQFMGAIPDPPKNYDYSDSEKLTNPRILVDFVSIPLGRITIIWDKAWVGDRPAGTLVYEYGTGSGKSPATLDRLLTVRVGDSTIRALEYALHESNAEPDLEP